MVKVGVGGSWAWIISFVGPLLFLQVFHFSQRGMRGGGWEGVYGFGGCFANRKGLFWIEPGMDF